MLPKMPESPRAWHRLIVVRVLASSLALPGCVEATAYEQATSAAAVQGEARRRLAEDVEKQSAELATLRAEHARLQAENARLQAQLSDRAGAVDQAELELVMAKHERNEEASLVRQLRGDLARVGGHLDTFAEEKEGLGAELESARAENERLSARVAELEAGRATGSSPAPETATGSGFLEPASASPDAPDEREGAPVPGDAE